MKLLLASQSPRRKELLEQAGYTFEVHPAKAEETFDLNCSLDEALEKVALHKALEVYDLYPEYLTLAADTIVVYDQQILGKPKSEQDAWDCLKMLSGQTHQVKTGVCLLYQNQKKCFVQTSEVHFRDLSDLDIYHYVSSGKCMDKAGAYGIQECDFVEWLDGSYSNVVGLPMEALQEVLTRFMKTGNLQ